MLTTPKGLDEILATFGDFDVPEWERDNLVPIPVPSPTVWVGKTISDLDDVPISHVRCHKLLVAAFTTAFEHLHAFIKQAVLPSPLRYAGIYNRRSIRGASAHPSTHCWGIAIDLYPNEYPLGSSKRFPQPVVDIMLNLGFVYGGDFKSRKDPMHFQFVDYY